MRYATKTAATAVLVFASILVSASAATAKGGAVTGTGNRYYLSHTFTTRADVEYSYGGRGDQVFVGDWNGDGVDTLAYRRGATFYIREDHGGGVANRAVTYGRPDDVVLVGDWDGDGVDTFAVRRGAEFHVRNSITSGPADGVAVYGRRDDVVLVGDWDGDGVDTFAVRRGAEYHVKNAIAAGSADRVAVYGRPGDQVIVGDWDGNRTDTFAVRRDARYFIKNTIATGVADIDVIYGRPADTTLVGDWDGNGSDSLGVRRDVEGAATAVAASALAWAHTQLGLPYVWGGTGPDGYDCSGLIMRAYEHAGVQLPRTTRQQYEATKRVPLDQLQPGDLVFWSSNGQPSGIYHAALYGGDGMRLQSQRPGGFVELVPMHRTNLMPFGGRF